MKYILLLLKFEAANTGLRNFSAGKTVRRQAEVSKRQKRHGQQIFAEPLSSAAGRFVPLSGSVFQWLLGVQKTSRQGRDVHSFLVNFLNLAERNRLFKYKTVFDFYKEIFSPS
ncbi:MAG: hypothetical protein J7539_08220 [Niabella sp.]|nr:hypothetical protein [Niabella sp.]